MYSPQEDSFLLARAVKKYAPHKRVLDMGTGSGILAHIAREAQAHSVLAVDINPDAVAYVKKQGIDAIHSDLFEHIPFEKEFDVIVCNPPYLPHDEREDAESQAITTGGKEGDEFTLRFLETAVNHLAKNGIILLIVSDLAPSHRLEALITELNLTKEVIETKKLFMETLECWKLTHHSNQ